MKIVKKVALIEVKRCFVNSQIIKLKKKNKGNVGQITKSDFKKKLATAEKKTLKLSEKQLDVIITKDWKKRLFAYNTSNWYLARVTSNEVGVWKRAGGLPLQWTNGSLLETAQKVRRALKINPKLIIKRVRYTIPSMIASNVRDIQSEKYLLPIVFKGNTGTRGRKRLKKQMRGDIDDGCMRSIALAVSGMKELKVYFGIPKIEQKWQLLSIKK